MNYLNTNALPAGHVIEAVIQDPVSTTTTHFIISNNKDLIMLEKYPPLPIYGKEQEPGFSLVQTEVSLGALPWIIDSIENKFWKAASQGGLSNSILHVNNLVENEDLLLRFTPNCGDEGEKGFTLENYARKPLRGSNNHQSIQLSNRLLCDSGLLELFKTIVSKYQIPYPSVVDAPPPVWN